MTPVTELPFHRTLFPTARVYEITAEGNKYLFDGGIKSGSIVLDVKAKQALAVYC